MLGFDTAHAFFTVLLAEAVVKADQKRLNTGNDDLRLTTAEFKAQLTTTNDVTRAQIEVSGAQRQLEQDKGVLERAYLALEFLVNARVDCASLGIRYDRDGRRQCRSRHRRPMR